MRQLVAPNDWATQAWCLVPGGENLELEPQGKFAIDERIFKANGSKTSYVGIFKYLYTCLRFHNEHQPGVKTPLNIQQI